ncbi:MAG: hypothetical protein EPO27_20770 [Betaproteobacteria bacterium]|nr:MAG: hypothetical protein EPO27_20770 [Betaproteobacteria bacterium]
MTYSDDDLMAYVDGELDAGTAAAIEAALAQDAALAGRVARQRQLRSAVHAAFEPVLAEPMPQRLLAAARGTPAAAPARARRWSGFEWGAMTASVAIGAVLGAVFVIEVRKAAPDTGPAADFVADATGLRARGALALALTEQLAATQAADAPVKIGSSFVSATGEYCRSFTLAPAAATPRLGGLACRRSGAWRLLAVADADRGGGAPDQYRQAGAPIPAPVLRAIEDRIQGSALDADAERVARQRGWER